MRGFLLSGGGGVAVSDVCGWDSVPSWQIWAVVSSSSTNIQNRGAQLDRKKKKLDQTTPGEIRASSVETTITRDTMQTAVGVWNKPMNYVLETSFFSDVFLKKLKWGPRIIEKNLRYLRQNSKHSSCLESAG